MRVAGLVGVCILFGATSCAYLPQRYQLAAEPLMPVSEIPPTLPPIDQVNVLVQDSQKKCAAFVNSMFAETAGSGVVLDTLSTSTSAVAAIVSAPVAPALSAASAVFGATKTSITANYLNTLTISHITQAIQSTYSTDITHYINSLAAADPSKIDVYLERSKIQSYHNECGLAAAEGSISSTLQPSGAPAGQAPSITYAITGAHDTTAGGLATALAVAINGSSSPLAQAGVTASASGPVISLNMKSPLTFQVTGSNPNFKASVVQGTPTTPAQVTVTITGALKKGDTVTITGTTATQQPGGSGQTAPAQPAGQATPQHVL